MSRYHKAQICLQGHVLTSYSEIKGKYCEECGSDSISSCINCSSPIHGDEIIEGVVCCCSYITPNYCYSCGKPYPWTEAKLEAIKELIDFDTQLSKDEKEYINDNVAALTLDIPKTKVVSAKFKAFIGKAGKATADATRDILVDIASEAAKKVIWGQ